MESLTRAVTAENFPAAILAQQKQPAANWDRALGLGMCALVWFYVAMLLVAWLLLATGGDRWWFSTLILFGPRWLCVLPLVLLVPMAAIWRRGLLWPLALAAILAVGPIMGLCLPWARLGVPKGPSLRVLTCNVKGQCHDNPALNELIRTAAPDIVALQGCWSDVRVAWPAGWQVCQEGETLIASRYRLSPLQGLSQDATEESGNAAPPRSRSRLHLLECTVTTPECKFCFCTVHPESPHYVIDRMLSRKTVLRPSASPYLAAEIAKRWQDSEDLCQRFRESGQPQIIAGDLNLPPDSAIYRKYWAAYWNAFGSAGLGFGYTEWPRVSRLPFGIRIDHILSDPRWRPYRCWVGPDVGSDHLPLIADLVQVPGKGKD